MKWMSKTGSFFTLNSQIRIQTVTIESKQINQKPPHCYSLTGPATSTSAYGIAWAVAIGLIPTRALPPTPTGLKHCRALTYPVWLLSPNMLALPPIGTLQTRYPRVQVSGQNKRRDMQITRSHA
jgi:hypothetical protein